VSREAKRLDTKRWRGLKKVCMIERQKQAGFLPLNHEKVIKEETSRGGKRRGDEEYKNRNRYVSLPSDELDLRDLERRLRYAKHGSNSLIRASPRGEQQAVVLVRHPDHTAGQVRSTRVKPISDVVSLSKV